MSKPTVFISYSWDGKQHQDWVLNLANKLIEYYDIDILLDQYELALGNNLQYFMEKSIINADKVLLIMTPNYREKADNRSKGVGYEYSMITQSLFENQIGNDKFIPVLRGNNQDDSVPIFLKSLVFHDMRESTVFDAQLYKLDRGIRGLANAVKPTFKGLPAKEEVNSFVAQAKKFQKEQDFKRGRKEYLASSKSVEEANNQFNQFLEVLDKKAKDFSKTTPLKFSLQAKSTIYSIGRNYRGSEDLPYGNLVGQEEFAFLFSLDFKMKNLCVKEWKMKKRQYYNLKDMVGFSSKDISFALDVDDELKPIWRSDVDDFFTIEDIASEYLDKTLQRIIEAGED